MEDDILFGTAYCGECEDDTVYIQIVDGEPVGPCTNCGSYGLHVTSYD